MIFPRLTRTHLLRRVFCRWSQRQSVQPLQLDGPNGVIGSNRNTHAKDRTDTLLNEAIFGQKTERANRENVLFYIMSRSWGRSRGGRSFGSFLFCLFCLHVFGRNAVLDRLGTQSGDLWWEGTRKHCRPCLPCLCSSLASVPISSSSFRGLRATYLYILSIPSLVLIEATATAPKSSAATESTKAALLRYWVGIWSTPPLGASLASVQQGWCGAVALQEQTQTADNCRLKRKLQTKTTMDGCGIRSSLLPGPGERRRSEQLERRKFVRGGP